MRECSKCLKITEDFYVGQTGHWCRPCRLEYNRDRRRLPESKLADRLRKRLDRKEKRHDIMHIRVKRRPTEPRMTCTKCGVAKPGRKFPAVCNDCLKAQYAIYNKRRRDKRDA